MMSVLKRSFSVIGVWGRNWKIVIRFPVTGTRKVWEVGAPKVKSSVPEIAGGPAVETWTFAMKLALEAIVNGRPGRFVTETPAPALLTKAV